jgi:NAD(P)-dependent dehydrogenase (short-subunit alcohol dehydrogenase family)
MIRLKVAPRRDSSWHQNGTTAPQLLQAGNGAVIAIASMYGLVGQYERVAYCGAKAGMLGMVRAMALDIADGRMGTCA